MQLSNNFINVLQNFSLINPSIQLKKGKMLDIVSPRKTVLARATFQEKTDHIDGAGAIYDVNMFLQTVGLSKTPSLEFHDKYFNIIDNDATVQVGRNKPTVRFQNADLKVLTIAEDGVWEKVQFKPKVTLELKWADINRVLRHAAILGLDSIAIIGDGKKVVLKATDFNNPTSDGIDVPIKSETKEKFAYVFRPDNFNLMSGLDYSVQLGAQSLWTAKSDKVLVEYFIALEKETNRDDSKVNVIKK